MQLPSEAKGGEGRRRAKGEGRQNLGTSSCAAGTPVVLLRCAVLSFSPIAVQEPGSNALMERVERVERCDVAFL